MPDGFPCPNPICPHTFPPDSVKGATALKCPRCGNVFQFAKQPAARPAARPAPPPPPPRPAAPVPVAAPVAPPAPVDRSALQFDDEPRPRRRPKSRSRPSGGGGLIVGLVVLAVVGSVAGGLAYYHFNVEPLFGRGGDPAGPGPGNFSFRMTTAWKADEKARRQLDANFAYTRSRPRGHVALAFHDYKTRQPSDDELVEEGVKRLKGLFPRLEYVDPLQAGEGKAGELGGEPALKLEFKAVAADEVPVTGECLMLSRRGYGYWWITWGPAEDEEDLPEMWEKLRGGFQFADGREGWQPSARPTTAVKVEGLPVQLDYVHGLWKPSDAPKDYDKLCELALRGFEAGGEKGRGRPDEYAGKAATVQVLVLPKSPTTPMAVSGAEVVIKSQLEKQGLMAKLEPYADPSGKAAASSPAVGAFKGEARQVVVKVGGEAIRFGVLAVARRVEGVLVIYCECPADRRGYWLGEFKALLETVRPAG